jgi:hypothetical protein
VVETRLHVPSRFKWLGLNYLPSRHTLLMLRSYYIDFDSLS